MCIICTFFQYPVVSVGSWQILRLFQYCLENPVVPCCQIVR